MEAPPSAQSSGAPSPEEVCRLVDAMVTGPGDEDYVVRGLMVIEIWCKHLREVIRDAGRGQATTVIVANRYADDQDHDHDEGVD